MRTLANTLLSTKLHIPSLRADLIPRPWLIERLQAGLECRLNLVSAPAGYGKTTLVSEWATSLNGETPPTDVAWLSLDEGDNAPVRFMVYLVTALSQATSGGREIVHGALSMLYSPQPVPSEAVLIPLINELADTPNRTVLVLDDYHVIEDRSTDAALAFLLDHAPSQLHLVIATRDDPHLPLARLRASGQLSELRAVDLRFSLEEAAYFLNEAMGLTSRQSRLLLSKLERKVG